MTCSKSAGEEPFFVKLPANIRDNIYCYAYLPTTIGIHTNSPWEKGHRLGTLRKAEIDALFVSKRFYQEAWDVLLLYGQFIAPINIQQTVALDAVSHLGSNTKRLLTVPSKNVHILKKIRQVEFRVQSDGPHTEHLGRSLINMSPLSEILPKLDQLQTIAVVWVGPVIPGSIVERKPFWSTLEENDAILLLVPLEKFQRCHDAVQITVSAPRSRLTMSGGRLSRVTSSTGPGYPAGLNRSSIGQRSAGETLSPGHSRFNNVKTGTIPSNTVIGPANLGRMSSGGTGSGGAGPTFPRLGVHSGRVSSLSARFDKARSQAEVDLRLLWGDLSNATPFADYMRELRSVVYGGRAGNNDNGSAYKSLFW